MSIINVHIKLSKSTLKKSIKAYIFFNFSFPLRIQGSAVQVLRLQFIFFESGSNDDFDKNPDNSLQTPWSGSFSELAPDPSPDPAIWTLKSGPDQTPRKLDLDATPKKNLMKIRIRLSIKPGTASGKPGPTPKKYQIRIHSTTTEMTVPSDGSCLVLKQIYFTALGPEEEAIISIIQQYS